MNESLRLKLSLTLCIAILVVALAAALFSFASALDEAHELQDDVLRQVAALIDQQHLSSVPFRGDDRLIESDEVASVIVQRLDDDAASGPLSLPGTLTDGLHTLDLGGQSFRVLISTTATSERIAVAQEAILRDRIARDSALRTVTPFLILIPVLLLIVADLIRKMFQPILALSNEIDRRAEQDLQPVTQHHFPREVRPFAVAINRLLARVARSMDAQRRFVADAAHELRSPLTALSLQAERLAEAEMSESARERLGSLRKGIERGRNLLDQLLALAKAQVSAEPSTSPTAVQQVYRRVLEDLMPLAAAKQIDIGIEGEQDVRIWVSELDLIAVVKNLVDNAIRYTPAGGRIDLSVIEAERRAELRIRDTGPGIALAERQRVFDPFYRSLGNDQIGSGLGLSIVQTIADRIGAELSLAYADEAQRRGLLVILLIPIGERRRNAAWAKKNPRCPSRRLATIHRGGQ